jgi:REP element-mobilizing transposase RayT
MANTFTQMYFHVVFAVKCRRNHIGKEWKDELFKYITGIHTNKKQKLIAINGVSNHIHILIGMKPDINLSNLVRDIKANSSKFITEKKLVNGKFEWQEGFGAFTLGHSQLDRIVKYIQKQEKHHNSKTFLEEYIEFLNLYQIDFDPRYLFDDV